MRTKILLTVLAMALAIAACSGEQSTLVTDQGKAPYYTSLAEAQAVAAANQYIVAEFYTDW